MLTLMQLFFYFGSLILVVAQTGNSKRCWDLGEIKQMVFDIVVTVIILWSSWYFYFIAIRSINP